MRIPFLGGIGVPELIIILIVVLLIFGPKNLPKLGNAIGKTFKSMRDGMDGKKKEDSSEDEPTSKAESKDDKQNVIEEEAVVEPVDDGEANAAKDEVSEKKTADDTEAAKAE